MKKTNLLLLLPGLFAAQMSFSQQTSHVTLSDQYPSNGETIILTYDPAGTPLDGKDDVSGKVYYLDNKSYPVGDLTFTTAGKLLKSSFTVNDSAKAFFIKIYKDDVIDNNSDAGYVYLVYKNRQPVPGAYASEAYALSSGLASAFDKVKIIKNPDALALYKKEFDLYPVSMTDYGTNYYYLLARSTDPANATIVTNKIAELETSGTEKDLQTASSLLSISKKKSQADSLNKIIAAKYPDGNFAKSQAYMEFFSAPDLVKKDSIYNVFVQKFPVTAADKTPYQDILAAQLAEAYSKTGDWANADKYIAQIQGESSLPGTLNDVAYEMAKKGENLSEADKMSKESLDLLQESMNSTKPMMYQSPADAKKSAQTSYDYYADTYALILLKENRLEDALKYEQKVYDDSKPLDAEEMEHYVTILNAMGKYQQAKQAAEENVKLGKSSPAIEEGLKTAYIKLNGSDKGYDTYLASLQAVAKQKAMAELAKTMINKPAPLFTLKDLDGNTVSLADLKGKVVIVDFWATWCGPCKASFPGMQLAVTKYKNDPNVKFLFVDCWENGDDFNIGGVKKFIADNNYTFHVLMDEKATDGRQSKVNSQFGVTGIPTKFIIDKNGNIRFTYVGYDGTPEALEEEVTDMINMAENPAAIPGQKVSMNN